MFMETLHNSGFRGKKPWIYGLFSAKTTLNQRFLYPAAVSADGGAARQTARDGGAEEAQACSGGCQMRRRRGEPRAYKERPARLPRVKGRFYRRAVRGVRGLLQKR